MSQLEISHKKNIWLVSFYQFKYLLGIAKYKAPKTTPERISIQCMPHRVKKIEIIHKNL